MACALAAGGCSAANRADPLEPMNRLFFDLNMKADEVVFEPVSRVYVAVVPGPVRDGLRNFFTNLGQLHVVANDLLQGRFDHAMADLGRFVVNATLGVGGLFDPATDIGMPRREQSFGVTMGVWGFEEGTYLVLPFLGPTTMSGLPDAAIGLFTTPLPYVNDGLFRGVSVGVAGVDALSAVRGEVEVVRDAVDPYIFVRDGYLQHQRALIRRARGEPDEPAVLPLPQDLDDLEGLEDLEGLDDLE